MSFLKPKPTPILVNGEAYSILFTLDVIDQLQSETEMPITELLEWAINDNTKESAIKCLLKFLTGANVSEENNLDYLSTILITSFIEQAKCKEIKNYSPPKSNKEIDFIDIEWWMYIGVTVLRHPEKEVWKMTLGKIGTLYREHLKYTGAIKEEQEVSLLSI